MNLAQTRRDPAPVDSVLPGVSLYSTCPPSGGQDDGAAYIEHALRVATWSQRAGCEGMLVYSDNSQVDPWLLSAMIIRNTSSLVPLVAVQPAYMHPYSVAKMIATIAYTCGRSVALNLIAGGYSGHLQALNDFTPHDQRYQRLTEYALIIRALLEGRGPVSFEGEFYKVKDLKLSPAMPAELFPRFLMSGSSEAGAAAAAAVGATVVIYPEPNGTRLSNEGPALRESGIRVGIINRNTEEEAWTAARTRFPEERKGQLTRQLASKVSDSVWHKQLHTQATVKTASPYWLVPFENYKSMCPYLVGSDERVAQELTGYMAKGCRLFILDVPTAAEDLHYSRRAIARALELSACLKSSKTG